jgi:ComF family protein
VFVISLLVELGLALLSPPTCAACDASIALRTAFCASCASTLVRASRSDAAFEYGGAMSRAIHRFKYEDRPDLARPLSAALARLAFPAIDGIVPVPLHPRRLAERGYNQSTLLAHPIARMRSIPMSTDVLERQRDTPRQAELDRGARQRNVIDAFRCRFPHRVRGKRWLLVDDVRTTGATLGACKQALFAAGAAEVHAIVLAVAL